MFIDWLKYVQDPLAYEQILGKKDAPSESFCWVDSVTGTKFFVLLEDAAKLTQAGISFVKKIIMSGDDAVNKIWKFLSFRDVYSRILWIKENKLFGYETTNETNKLLYVALWPELPYIEQEISATGKSNEIVEKCWRLADFLLIRTGIFYALAASQIPEGKWQEIRLGSLLSGSNVFSTSEKLPVDCELTGELEQAMRAATRLAGYAKSNDEELLELCGKLTPVEVVKGGAVRIKEYYLETNRIGEIRGASILLDDINRNRYEHFFVTEPGLTPEGIIYAGGGNLLAVVPKGMGLRVAEEVEHIHKEVCLTVRAVAVYLSVSAQDLSDYKSMNEKLENAVLKRRGVWIPCLGDRQGDINYCNPNLWDYYKKANNYRDANDGKLCSSCGVRPVDNSWTYKGESERELCISCLRKQFVGQNLKKKALQNEYGRYLKSRNEQAEEFTFAKELDDIADSNKEIAVLYGDGNNFGPLFGNCNSLTELRYLSRFCEGAAFTSTFATLRKFSEELKEHTIELIAIGGDDIFIIVPANIAFSFAINLGQAFDSLFRNYSKEENCDKTAKSPTMSLGVIISSSKTPVRYLFELAQKLLKTAKQKSRQDANGYGTLDIAVLNSYAAYEDDIDFYRKATLTKENTFLTIRPFTYKQALAFKEALFNLQSGKLAPGRSWFYGLREATTALQPLEADLFFYYQYARLKPEQREYLWKIFRKIMSGVGAKISLFNDSGEGRYSFLVDIVELWDYVGKNEGGGF